MLPLSGRLGFSPTRMAGRIRSMVISAGLMMPCFWMALISVVRFICYPLFVGYGVHPFLWGGLFYWVERGIVGYPWNRWSTPKIRWGKRTQDRYSREKWLTPRMSAETRYPRGYSSSYWCSRKIYDGLHVVLVGIPTVFGASQELVPPRWMDGYSNQSWRRQGL